MQNAELEARNKLKSARRIVVKLGTSTVTDAAGGVCGERVEPIARAIAELMVSGRQVVLVSSGAVGLGSSGSLQQPAQRVQAPPAGRTDAADRKPEFVGYLGVGSGWVGHEHLKQLLPAPGEMGKRPADVCRALIGQKPLIDLRRARDIALECDVVLNRYDFLACCQVAQALVPRGSRQPGADAIRMVQLVDVLEQAQPRRLRDVGGVTLGQLELAGYGPDEPGILVDQPLPCPLVSLSRALHHVRGRCGVQRGDLSYRYRSDGTFKVCHDAFRYRGNGAFDIGHRRPAVAARTRGGRWSSRSNRPKVLPPAACGNDKSSHARSPQSRQVPAA